MANYMQDERKKELVKRRQVQEDFTNVVTKIFDVTLGGNKMTDDELKEVDIISVMSKKLASLLSLSVEKCNEIFDYSKIHVSNHVSFDTKEDMSEDEKFEALRKQTELGSALISRYQLSRKCEDIIRASLEGSDDDDFIKTKREIQSNLESQIILICEMYVTLRSVKSYKRANNHQKSIQFLQDKCQVYFDPVVFDRFIRFGQDFEKIYDEM
jgi:response regulator RpfG family c-di-GMP phosphodiesterase